MYLSMSSSGFPAQTILATFTSKKRRKVGQDSSGADQQWVLQHHPEVQPVPLSLRCYTNAAEEIAQASKGGIQLVLGTTEGKSHLSEHLSREHLIRRQVFYHANTAFLEEGKASTPSLPPQPYRPSLPSRAASTPVQWPICSTRLRWPSHVLKAAAVGGIRSPFSLVHYLQLWPKVFIERRV